MCVCLRWMRACMIQTHGAHSHAYAVMACAAIVARQFSARSSLLLARTSNGTFMYSLMPLVTSDPVTQHSRAPGASLSACPANLPLSLFLSELSFMLPRSPGPAVLLEQRVKHVTSQRPIPWVQSAGPRDTSIYTYMVLHLLLVQTGPLSGPSAPGAPVI